MKVKLKLVLSLIFTFFVIISIRSISNAASVSIQCAGSATVGKEFTISAVGSGAQWNLSLAVNGKTIATNSELESVSNKTISFSGKYTPTNTSSLNITLTGTVTDENGTTIRSFPSKTVSVVNATTNSTTSSPTTNSNSTNNNSNGNSNNANSTSTQKSNVAALSNLGIKPNDFTGFNKNKTSYNVEVPYETEKVSVYATAANNGKVTSGTGNKTLQVGANAVNVVVTAEDGKTTKTYTLNIVRKEQEVKEENTISEGNVVENIENNIDANTLLEGNVENSIEEPSNDVSNQLLISTKDDSKINKKLISDCIIGVAFAIIILLLIIYYTTQYNKDEDFEEQEDNTNSVEPEEEKSKKEEINKEANKNETINVDIEVPKKHQKGKRFK